MTVEYAEGDAVPWFDGPGVTFAADCTAEDNGDVVVVRSKEPDRRAAFTFAEGAQVSPTRRLLLLPERASAPAQLWV